MKNISSLTITGPETLYSIFPKAFFPIPDSCFVVIITCYTYKIFIPAKPVSLCTSQWVE
jgi:hypothetical protein